MPHIKWVGIINSEIADYQKGNMDCSAKKMVLPATIKDWIYCGFYRIDCPRMAARYCISCKRNCLYRFSSKVFCCCCSGLLSIEKMEIYPNVFTSSVIRDCACCDILV